ncbi:hypothetical protein ACOMHN_015225 [Nucella lapillus]
MGTTAGATTGASAGTTVGVTTGASSGVTTEAISGATAGATNLSRVSQDLFRSQCYEDCFSQPMDMRASPGHDDSPEELINSESSFRETKVFGFRGKHKPIVRG